MHRGDTCRCSQLLTRDPNKPDDNFRVKATQIRIITLARRHERRRGQTTLNTCARCLCCNQSKTRRQGVHTALSVHSRDKLFTRGTNFLNNSQLWALAFPLMARRQIEFEIRATPHPYTPLSFPNRLKVGYRSFGRGRLARAPAAILPAGASLPNY